MFYTGGEAISDQFHPLKFICFWVSLHRYGKVLGILPLRGGASSYSQKQMSKYWFFCENQKCSLWPKCKINTKKIFVNRMSPRGGGGGGPGHLGQIPKKCRFFWTSPLTPFGLPPFGLTPFGLTPFWLRPFGLPHRSQVPWGPNFVKNGDPILSDMGT